VLSAFPLLSTPIDSPGNQTADIILTTEAPGPLRTAVSPSRARPWGRSYRFSFGDGMHSLLRHLLIVAGGSHHSRARDRQLSPPSSPVDHLPSLLGGGSAVLGVETGHRARRSRRLGRLQDRSSVNRNTRRPDPSSPSSRPGTDEGQRPDGGRSGWLWPARAWSNGSGWRSLSSAELPRLSASPMVSRVSKQVGQQEVGHQRVGCLR
jgi:hypothetical protein